MIEKKYYIYISTNWPRRTVLYTGVSSSLIKRDGQHKLKFNRNSFTARFNVNRIVYLEVCADPVSAINREKQIKAGSRKNKIKLIIENNPEWDDLVAKYTS
jgi:putative endonuclease